ncbi:unnamed protein product [Arabidopsis halleri]
MGKVLTWILRVLKHDVVLSDARYLHNITFVSKNHA